MCPRRRKCRRLLPAPPGPRRVRAHRQLCRDWRLLAPRHERPPAGKESSRHLRPQERRFEVARLRGTSRARAAGRSQTSDSLRAPTSVSARRLSEAASCPRTSGGVARGRDTCSGSAGLLGAAPPKQDTRHVAGRLGPGPQWTRCRPSHTRSVSHEVTASRGSATPRLSRSLGLE